MTDINDLVDHLDDVPFHGESDDPGITQVLHLSTALHSTPLLIPEWLVVAAIHGTGSLLLGPHHVGAQAVIPPAVLTRTPVDHEDEYSDIGWRVATWRFAPGATRVDAHRPIDLHRLPLLDVLAFIRRETIAHEAWLHEEIQLRARCLATLIRYADTDAQTLITLRLELDDLLLDCAAAFGQHWCDQYVSDI